MGGTHLSLKTDKETLDVHIGPSHFLEQSKFAFAKGDQVEITGSKVKVQGSEAFLAREVKKGDTRKHEAYIPTPVLMDWVKGRFAGSYHHCMQHANRSYGPIKRRLATAMLRGYVKHHTRLRYVALAKLGLGLSRVVGAAKFVKGY